MKKFFGKWAKFGFSLLVFCTLSLAFNSFMYTTDRYLVREGTRVLILGDSHIQRGVRQEFIPLSENVAFHAEPFLMTLPKLEALLDANSGIELVVLGFSNHNIAQYNDGKFSNEFSEGMYSRYYPVARGFFGVEVDKKPTEHVNALIRYYLFPDRTYVGRALQRVFGRSPGLPPYIGIESHDTGSTDTREALMRRISFHYEIDAQYPGPSQTTLMYLDSITNLVERRGLKLLLLSTPVRQEYYREIPISIKTSFDSIMDVYRTDNVVEVLDATAFPFAENLFMDFDHLNDAGADSISKIVRHTIEMRWPEFY